MANLIDFIISMSLTGHLTVKCGSQVPDITLALDLLVCLSVLYA